MKFIMKKLDSKTDFKSSSFYREEEQERKSKLLVQPFGIKPFDYAENYYQSFLSLFVNTNFTLCTSIYIPVLFANSRIRLTNRENSLINQHRSFTTPQP